MQNKINELEKGANLLKLVYETLDIEASSAFINSVFEKFKPTKVSGHLSIGSDKSEKIKTEDNEFHFSLNLEDEPIYVFFEQDGINKSQVFILLNGKMFSSLLEECFGIEYFISNKTQDYLISVNWYVIEILKAQDL